MDIDVSTVGLALYPIPEGATMAIFVIYGQPLWYKNIAIPFNIAVLTRARPSCDNGSTPWGFIEVLQLIDQPNNQPINQFTSESTVETPPTPNL